MYCMYRANQIKGIAQKIGGGGGGGGVKHPLAYGPANLFKG